MCERGTDVVGCVIIHSLFLLILHARSRVGFPVLVRPSHVLSGTHMRVVRSSSELDEYMRNADVLLGSAANVVVTKFAENA